MLLSIDLLPSLYAADVVGPDREANPLTARLLGESLFPLVAVHLAAVVVAAAFFSALFELVRELARAYRGPTALSVEVFLGLLVAAGLFVFANDLTLVVPGESLV